MGKSWRRQLYFGGKVKERNMPQKYKWQEKCTIFIIVCAKTGEIY